jgi:hypothetical protein
MLGWLFQNLLLYLLHIKLYAMNIYEKAGDILANVAQLVIGGVILTNVIQEDFDGTTIYLMAALVSILLFGGAFGSYYLSKKKS